MPNITAELTSPIDDPAIRALGFDDALSSNGKQQRPASPLISSALLYIFLMDVHCRFFIFSLLSLDSQIRCISV